MVISNNYNKFYHGTLLGDLYKQMIEQKRIAMSFDKFKQAIKYANKTYPRHDGGELVSTMLITNKDLGDHIEWIIRWSSSYGLTLKYIEEQWQELLKESR